MELAVPITRFGKMLYDLGPWRSQRESWREVKGQCVQHSSLLLTTKASDCSLLFLNHPPPPISEPRVRMVPSAHLGSFWMLSMEGDLASVASGGSVGPDLLYGESVEGQNCSVRYGSA